MYHITIVAQSSAGSIPSMLLPWLAGALILVCLWCMVEVIRRIRKDGVTKFNLPLVLVCLSTVVFLGFGAEAVREIYAAQDFLRALAALNDPMADNEDLIAAMDRAPSDEDRLLAFDTYSRVRPHEALQYLRTQPGIPKSVIQREGRLLAVLGAEKALDLDPVGKIEVENFKMLQGLIDLGKRDPQVAAILKRRKFDTSKLRQDQLAEILRKHGAFHDGDGIVIRPGSRR